MPDSVGTRAKLGVIIPSTNTVVEHDLYAVRPEGITFHFGRMYIEAPDLSSDDAFEALLGQVRESITVAIRDVMTCEPDYLVMGMSAETFWGGKAGGEEFVRKVREQSGLECSTGAAACEDAIAALGLKRIAVLTPYQPVGDEQVRGFFGELGVEIVRLHGLKCPSATSIARITEAEVLPILRELDGPDVDAIVQVGTNLSFVRLADEAERWLGKPVVAINAATLWHALRANGFQDRFTGFGPLLRDH
ncbi:MAG: arylmalonate decarboxylase [Thermoleophilia bacterium]